MLKSSLAAVCLGLFAFTGITQARPAFFDQIGADPTITSTGQGAGSQEFPDFPAFSVIAIDDFTTTQAWKLTTAEGAFFGSSGTFNPNQPTAWRVSIYSAASAPTSASLAGDVANIALTPAQMSFTTFAGSTYLVSLNLASANVTLPAGSYWMGITATMGFGTNGQDYDLQGSIVNGVALNARQINPGNGFAMGTNFAISPAANLEYRLSGTAVPEPISLGALTLGGLAMLRRRRA